MKKKRELTPEQQADAARLKSLYKQEKAAYKAKGWRLTHDVVAEALDVTPAAVSHYLNGVMALNVAAAAKFARFFNVSLDRISPRLAEMLPNATVAPPKHSSLSDKVPLLTWEQAGHWQEVAEAVTEGGADQWMICPVQHSQKTFALTVRGQSMSAPGNRATFEDGDVIHVDPEVSAENNSLVVVRLEESSEATFKQLVIEDGQRYLRALNPSWPNRIIEMPADAVVVGVVISKLVSFR